MKEVFNKFTENGSISELKEEEREEKSRVEGI